jgi:TonB family protein
MNTVEGTYEEMWVSDSQWRRETEITGLKRVEVGTSKRDWVLDSDQKGSPRQFQKIPSVLQPFPPPNTKFNFKSVSKSALGNNTASCAITKPTGPRKERSAFCFDPVQGFLVQRISPEQLPNGDVDYACTYDKFKKIGEGYFPTEIECKLAGQRVLQLRVLELSAATFEQSSLFSPPDGAHEYGFCLYGKIVPPKIVSDPQPKMPKGEQDPSIVVVVQLTVDATGAARYVSVARSGGKSFDEAAISAVEGWRFKAATCDGEPFPVEILADVSFFGAN